VIVTRTPAFAYALTWHVPMETIALVPSVHVFVVTVVADATGATATKRSVARTTASLMGCPPERVGLSSFEEEYSRRALRALQERF
jgi:hypothetical protein